MKDGEINLKLKSKNTSYVFVVIGILVFCLAMSLWAYTLERRLSEKLGISLDFYELDTFLGLSIVGVGVIILGLIIWADSILPREVWLSKNEETHSKSKNGNKGDED